MNTVLLRKVVTEKEIESGRISLPARVRDYLFPHVSQNSKTAATMVDEKGDSYDVVLKVRHNRTKPEIMAKGGKKFAQKRKLKLGDVLVFSRGDEYSATGHFRVTVKTGPILTPPKPPVTPAEGFAGLSGSSEPPATNVLLFGQCLIGFDRAPIVQPPAATVVELSLSLSIKPTPLLVLPVAPKPGSSIGSDHTYLELLAKPAVAPSSSAGGIKAEVLEVGPTLELTLGPPPVAKAGTRKFLEPKPPTALSLATPSGLDNSSLFLSLGPLKLRPKAQPAACPGGYP